MEYFYILKDQPKIVKILFMSILQVTILFNQLSFLLELVNKTKNEPIQV